MPLHFVQDGAGSSEVGDAVVLTGAEAHHAAAVRRVRVGEQVTVGDGRGVWLEGECEAVSPKEVVVRVDSRRFVEPPHPRVVLVQALAKGDRDELAVQSATELGVDAIVPWQAARSISRWDAAKAVKGVARWQSIAREAAKQAHRAWLPEVEDPVTTAELASRAAISLVLVLEPTADEPLTALEAIAAERGDILLVVGPEGGIAPEELERLQRAGARTVRLGDTVLRTSTAGPAALAVVSAALGRW
ncbi:MAG: 16S rRNA (uracil(1498)-N(3))-methyltransferase [Microbacterium sp.]|jgi:16S rRNA (uracil1498-N3)-methyltransferase|uniref:16S rRNA (uracil(1498)-N(3))-methyltransferase n=1 Tax=unclassified Microbacterium TaxID=2609290 RepID=UPI000DB8EB3C|nr:16S rRNA (uracil(1498)-N(3))-methyltransferase [Microbacterium sp.]PZU38124.1 MAG: 16S rRNA (uracil(1498)-N(3))-methyltransferase [Microbacterium sp.]